MELKITGSNNYVLNVAAIANLLELNVDPFNSSSQDIEQGVVALVRLLNQLDVSHLSDQDWGRLHEAMQEVATRRQNVLVSRRPFTMNFHIYVTRRLSDLLLALLEQDQKLESVVTSQHQRQAKPINLLWSEADYCLLVRTEFQGVPTSEEAAEVTATWMNHIIQMAFAPYKLNQDQNAFWTVLETDKFNPASMKWMDEEGFEFTGAHGCFMSLMSAVWHEQKGALHLQVAASKPPRSEDFREFKDQLSKAIYAESIR